MSEIVKSCDRCRHQGDFIDCTLNEVCGVYEPDYQTLESQLAAANEQIKLLREYVEIGFREKCQKSCEQGGRCDLKRLLEG